MAQRIRSCTNNTNFDTINCDSYLPRLLKRDKPVIANKTGSGQKFVRECCAVSNLGTSAVSVTPPNLKSRSATVRQQNLQPVQTPSNPLNVAHPEHSPVVEVTVRTHSNRRSCTGDAKSNNQTKPWGKLLKTAKSSETVSTFSNFDPLRTLHFLAKELQSKLKTVAPNDNNILQMVSDMEQALNRIPREVASSVRLIQEFESLKNQSKNEFQEFPITTRPCVDHKSCQTLNTGDVVTETEIFHKQLEASAEKLEAAYRTMEKLCNQVKTEKEEIELLLYAEKDTVKFLRKQINELETEKSETRNMAFEKLAEERDNLQSQVKRLQGKIESQNNSSAFRELKAMVEELQNENARVEQENLNVRHKLALCSMEKEKYIAILNVRDRQISEIRAEMNQLQEVISEQLTELQRSSFNSSPTNQNTALGNFNEVLLQQETHHRNAKETGDNLQPSVAKKSAPPRLRYEDVQYSCRESPSGDSSSANLECVTSQIKKKVYESGISPNKVFKLFSSGNTAAGV